MGLTGIEKERITVKPVTQQPAASNPTTDGIPRLASVIVPNVNLGFGTAERICAVVGHGCRPGQPRGGDR
jgi:hypothetical protein